MSPDREHGETSGGTARLLALGAEDRFGALPQGTEAVAMSCQSEGALQIYLEPVVAVPHLVVIGDSPMACALSDMATALDWRVERLERDEFSAGRAGERSIVVVATQGHGDEDTIVTALKAAPAYVGVVASRRRADAVRAFLADQGVDADDVAALRMPAGLDLGSTTHKEVAVAILAELVQLRTEGAFHAPVPIADAAPVTAVDPVCGMTVEITPGGHSLEIDGETFHYCCPGCRARHADERGVR